MRSLLLLLALAVSSTATAQARVARDTADVAAKGNWSVGVFNPLKYALTDRLELVANPLVFFVAPHATARYALLQSDALRLTAEGGLSVPTFGMRLTKGYLFPTWANSTNDIGWMVVPRLGLLASGGPRTGMVWTGIADFSFRVPFQPTATGGLNSFLAPLDLLFAAPLTGFVARAGGALDVPLGEHFRLRAEANVHLTGPQGNLLVDGQSTGPLRELSPWYFTGHLGLDFAVGKSSRITAGIWYGNYDQGATRIERGADGFANRVRVRSNNILPTVDFIWST